MNYNHWIFKIWPFSRYEAITLPWGIYYKKTPSINLIKHELKHLEQKKSFGTMAFYIKYFLEFCGNLIKYKSWKKAYKLISFEIEAKKAEKL